MSWFYNQDLAAYGDVLTPFPEVVVGLAVALIVFFVIYGLFIN